MSLPYFPMYPTDFEADTAHLSLAEDGAYNRLLRLMWMTPGCSLPDDNAWIARRMRADTDTMATVVLPVIAEFMERKGGRVVSPRLQREWKKVDETSRLRSEAGKKGGRPKVVENKHEHEKPGFDFDKARPKQPEPEPERKEEPIGSSKKTARRKPEMELPPDWVPSERNIEDAESRQFSAMEIQDEADRFRNHHLAKGSRFRDWDAAWRTWLGNARKYGSRGSVAFGAAPGGHGRGGSIASIVARRWAAGEN